MPAALSAKDDLKEVKRQGEKIMAQSREQYMKIQSSIHENKREVKEMVKNEVMSLKNDFIQCKESVDGFNTKLKRDSDLFEMNNDLKDILLQEVNFISADEKIVNLD